MPAFEKRGLLFELPRDLGWAVSHAAIPTPDRLDDGSYHIYYSARDADNRASIGRFRVKIEGDALRVVEIERVPVLGLGELGAFDDALTVVRGLGTRVSNEKVTGQDVTECTGGARRLTETSDLAVGRQSHERVLAGQLVADADHLDERGGARADRRLAALAAACLPRARRRLRTLAWESVPPRTLDDLGGGKLSPPHPGCQTPRRLHWSGREQPGLCPQESRPPQPGAAL